MKTRSTPTRKVKPKQTTTSISVTVPEELPEPIDLRARELGMNRSRYVVSLIKADLAALNIAIPPPGAD